MIDAFCLAGTEEEIAAGLEEWWGVVDSLAEV